MKKKIPWYDQLGALAVGIICFCYVTYVTLIMMFIVEPLFFFLPFKLIYKKDKVTFQNKKDHYISSWKGIFKSFK